MAYSTMIVNKARSKKGSRGKVRVRGRKKGAKKTRNHFESSGGHDARGWSMSPSPYPLTVAEQEIILDLPGRRKSGCRLDSKAVDEIVHPLTSAPLLEILNGLTSKGIVEKVGGCFRLTTRGEHVAQNTVYEAGRGNLRKLVDAHNRSGRGAKKTRNCKACPSRNASGLRDVKRSASTALGLMHKAHKAKYTGLAMSHLDGAERHILMAKDEITQHVGREANRLEEDLDVYLEEVRASKRALSKGGLEALRRIPVAGYASRNQGAAHHTGQWDHVQVKRGASYAVSRNGKRPKYVLVVDVEDGDSWSTTFGEFLRDNKDSPDLDAWKALRVGQTIGVGGGAAPRFEVTGLAAKPARKAPKRNKKKSAKKKAKKKPARRNAPKSKKKATKRAPKKKVVKRRVTTTTTVTKRVVAERNSAALRNFYNLRQDLD